MNRSRVAVVIPCLNEELTVASVVTSALAATPEARVYVFDNNSTDQTAHLARLAGATVILSAQPGKGSVLNHAFRILDEDVLIFVDGDGTYDMARAPRMAELVLGQGYDMVICNRKAVHTHSAFPRFHQIGNYFFSKLVSFCVGQKVSDVFSGYRALSRDFYKSLFIDSVGFEIESELTIKAISQSYRTCEVTGQYGARPEGSFSKLRTYLDGFLILKFIFNALRDCRPLMFFCLTSFLMLGLSLASGWAPIQDYIQFKYVYTVPRAVLAGCLMILSSTFFAVGLILDSQLRIARQQSKIIKNHMRAQVSSQSPGEIIDLKRAG